MKVLKNYCILPLFGRINDFLCFVKLEQMSKTIIERMCSIAEKMRPEDEKSGMPISNIKKAAADIRALSRTLEMSPVQVVLLTAIVQKAARYSVCVNDLAQELGLEYLRFLTYNKETEGLRKRGYIRINNDGDIVMPKSVLTCLKENTPVKPILMTGLDADELLSRIKRALTIREENQCTTQELLDEVNLLMELNPDNSVSRSIRKIQKDIPRIEEIVLYGLIYRYYFEDDDMVDWHDMSDYLDEEDLDQLKSMYKREFLSLQLNDIIEYTGRDGLIEKDYFRLKTEVKEEIFADTGGLWIEEQKISASRKLLASEIMPKILFYNDTEGRQVSQLKKLMSKRNFNEIRERMKNMGLRTGFTCLFYGGPGTGKTETAYQVARESGRDLFIVDVSKVKSCWVGESEKNIKGVFDKYRQTVNAGGEVPILLFNEADAIFGIRQEGVERAVDKMENSIQNIILQEMEDLEGILIATTNLTANLDKAFERRFLYKIKFEKPSQEAKKQIWKAMMPELSEADARYLASKFEFSGAQIENIVRKKTIQSILYGSEPSREELLGYCCEEERGAGTQRTRIGF
jgi:AAA+ superfamily predicted ATPase